MRYGKIIIRAERRSNNPHVGNDAKFDRQTFGVVFLAHGIYRIESSVETGGDTAVRKFLNTGGGAGGGCRSRGGGGSALRALLQLQSRLLRGCARVMGGGRRRGAVMRPSGIQQHL